MTAARPYPTLEDHYRQMFGTGREDEPVDSGHNEQAHRPVSWHPSSARFSSSFYQSASSESGNTSQNTSSPSVQSTSDYENDSPEDQFTPGEVHATQHGEPTPQSEDVTWSSYFGTQMPLRPGPPSYSATMDEPKSWLLPEYSQASYEPPKYQTIATNQQGDFLPIQRPPPEPIESDVHGDKEEHPLARQNSKELIGMGLYDDPETTPFNLLTIGGKGLKLEEGWQPPEDMINDSDDADGENDSSDDEDEPPKPPPAPALPTVLQGAPQLPLMNMSGQSFLFDDADDDTITSDWWYHMKQPNDAAPDAAGLGYGWLRPS
jgi:hypothetical protein